MIHMLKSLFFVLSMFFLLFVAPLYPRRGRIRNLRYCLVEDAVEGSYAIYVEVYL